MRGENSGLNKAIMPFFYKDMLSIKAPFHPSDDKLDALAEFVTQNTINDSSTIPAGYTYLSQFIDHDISLDAIGRRFPWEIKHRPAELYNKRSPFFNLDTLYSVDDKQSFTEVDRSDLMETKSLLKIGQTIPDGKKPSFKNDLPRYANSVKARIVDGRNDENLGVAQTHVAFIRFHNAIVKHLGGDNTTEMFEEARRRTIRHYQWIILHDFLPKLVKKEVLEDVIKNGNKFYYPTDDDVFIPLEFSVGAYRAGHSMIRNTYNWNLNFNNDPNSPRASIKDLIKFTGSSCDKKFDCMAGEMGLPNIWIINWNWFYNINDLMHTDSEHFNTTAKLNTNISTTLGNLAPKLVNGFNRLFSLPAFDLYRTRAMELPAGQMIAGMMTSKMDIRVLQPEEIEPLLPKALEKEFSVETPLWFYLLAEAELNKNAQGKSAETMGDVGSRIIAETFVELLKRSEYSIFDIDFPSHPDFLGEKPDNSGDNNNSGNPAKFGMAELLNFVEKIEPGFLNPLATS
ncbi:MAG TPA: peroxidase family protein [Pyrinomonadaceae bacterium]